MNKSLLYFAFAILIVGCAIKDAPSVKQWEQREDETRLAFFALDAEARAEHETAAHYYWELFKQTDSTEYRNRFFEAKLREGAYGEVQSGTSMLLAREGPEDARLSRYHIRALMGLGEIETAKQEAVALVERTREKRDYLLVSELYAHLKHYDTALKYLRGAYMIDYDADALDKMAVILYVNLERKKEAIAELESHSRLHGCSVVVCRRLAGFYSDQNDAEGVLGTYLRLYEHQPDPAVAEAIIRIYGFQRNVLGMQKFLEKYGVNDTLLLKIYVDAKVYDKAAELAEKIYDAEGDPAYLGQSAIFAFEAATTKDDALILSVVDKLKRAVKSRRDPLMLNYLGYLLIDHDVDYKDGITYVQAALELEPESPFYLDSLAWGYYKMGRCEKAQRLMQRVLEHIDNPDDPEVQQHLRAIEACLKENP